jgi:hypothetical protein
VDGAEEAAPRGRLIVSLHYGSYSSLLWLALARTAPGPVRFLLDLRLDPHLVLPERRRALLEQEGLLPPGTLLRADRGACGPAVARTLLEALRRGETVVVLPDAYVVSPSGRSLALQVGRRTLGLPRGAAWLARASGCAVAAAWIHADGQGDRVSVRAADGVEGALRILERDALAADPAQWECWLRDQRGL